MPSVRPCNTYFKGIICLIMYNTCGFGQTQSINIVGIIRGLIYVGQLFGSQCRYVICQILTVEQLYVYGSPN